MIGTLVCLLIMLALQILTPHWWWVMIVAFAYGAAGGRRPARTGLLAAGLLWLGAGTYFYLTDGRIIAGRMARLFGLGPAWTMLAATALVAAVAAGISGHAGRAVRQVFRKAAKEETS
jgi:hypothetical protein